MGYDLYVMLESFVDINSGMPCVYTTEGMQILRSDTYVVPEEHRKYLNNRGWIFDLYVPRSCKQDICSSIDANYLADRIPSWVELKPMIPSDWVDSWHETDHNGFKNAMDWFSSMGCYTVHWSY
jgi:hypothetical protein